MAQRIIEPKKGKDGQIEFYVNYHDKKSDNSFTITITSDLNEAVEKLKMTLEGEVASMQQQK
jgi:copper(I)-binding protein